MITKLPIRLGEMEVNNLLISKRPDIVTKLLKSHSTSEADRDALNRALITAKDPFNLNVEVDQSQPSVSRAMLDQYLKLLDLELTSSKDNKSTED